MAAELRKALVQGGFPAASPQFKCFAFPPQDARSSSRDNSFRQLSTLTKPENRARTPYARK
jgi:hypothetical protein